MLLSATFVFTIVNIKQLSLLGFLLNLSETDPDGKLRKSAFTWLMLGAIWSTHLGDIGQKVQRMKAKIVSVASGNWLLLTYYLMA